MNKISEKKDNLETVMREDDSFLAIVTTDLDMFCDRLESGKDTCFVLAFPAIEYNRRRLLHSLIEQRYPELIHSSFGVDPDRRPVVMPKDFLLQTVMPHSLNFGNKSLKPGEFQFFLALLEACRDTSDAKKYIERLYSRRLVDERAHIKNSFDHTDLGKPIKDDSNEDIYVPRPIRLLREQQKAMSLDKGDAKQDDLVKAMSNTNLNEFECKQRRISNSALASINKYLAPDSKKDRNSKPIRSNGVEAFLTEYFGNTSEIMQLPSDRYNNFKSEPPPLDYEAVSHVLEISGFPKDWRGSDIKRFLPPGTFLHWVDDCRLLAVFKSVEDAENFTVPPEVCVSFEAHPLKNAAIESQYKAYRIYDDLVDRLKKPQTSVEVVRRVLNHHLRLGILSSSAQTPRSKPSNALVSHQ